MTRRQTVPIENSILLIRGQRVILAADLAKIYGVETRALNQAVKRNGERFPEDFTFRLTREEAAAIARSRSQSVILKRGENIKYLPSVFTEHGAIMAANVLNSPHAVRMSVYVVRAFIRLRHTVAFQKEIMVKLDQLERKVTAHDAEIKRIVCYGPTVDGAAGVQQKEDRLPCRRKVSGLQTAVAGGIQ